MKLHEVIAPIQTAERQYAPHFLFGIFYEILIGYIKSETRCNGSPVIHHPGISNIITGQVLQIEGKRISLFE